MPDDTQPVAAKSSSNKMWYVIGGVVALVLVGGFLSRNAGFLAMRAAGVNVQQTGGGGGTVTYSTNEGTVTVGGGSMPSSWPADAPANFAGASVQYSGESNPQTGKAGSVVIYSVKASAKSVVDYYKSELSKNGWTIEGTTYAASTNIISATKDTRSLGISIVDGGDGSVTVSAGFGQ